MFEFWWKGHFDLDCQCHGVVYGLIGVFNTDKLILVAQNQFVGTLPGDNHVYKIQRILVINLKSNEQFTDNNLEVWVFKCILFI